MNREVKDLMKSEVDLTYEEEEEVDTLLDIDIKSAFDLQRYLQNHPKLEARWHRRYAAAVKAVDHLSLALEIQISEILDEMEAKIQEDTGKKPSVYQRTELRKSSLPSDRRYQKLKRKLADATETMNTLRGVTFAFSSRGRRLTDLGQLMNRILKDDPTVWDNRRLGQKADEAAEKMKYD